MSIHEGLGTTPEDAETYARAIVAACGSMKNTPEALARFVAALIVDVQKETRRAAKLEVLRELERRHTEECFKDPPMESESMLWVKAIDGLRASLETEAAEPAKEEKRND